MEAVDWVALLPRPLLSRQFVRALLAAAQPTLSSHCSDARSTTKSPSGSRASSHACALALMRSAGKAMTVVLLVALTPMLFVAVAVTA